jgi:uncharacterized protein YcbX
LQGEALESTEVDGDGLRHDRSWGIRSLTTGLVLTGRRRPDLLLASARIIDDAPQISLPDGTTVHGISARTDGVLSEWLGEPVELVAAVDVPASMGEYFADATDDTSAAIEWTMPPGRFVDALPILLVTDATLATAGDLYPEGDWDIRRFRPNILAVDAGHGWAEDPWVGRTVTIGSMTLVPRAACQRCTMVTRPQPQLVRDLDVYRTLLHHHAGTLGVWSAITTPGRIRLHDPIHVTGPGTDRAR